MITTTKKQVINIMISIASLLFIIWLTITYCQPSQYIETITYIIITLIASFVVYHINKDDSEYVAFMGFCVSGNTLIMLLVLPAVLHDKESGKEYVFGTLDEKLYPLIITSLILLITTLHFTTLQ